MNAYVKALTTMLAPDYIDHACLSELSDVLDAEMLQGLISKFIQDTEIALSTLDQHASSDTAMAEILHKIAGSAAALGAVRFRKELIAAENALREGQRTQANQFIGEFRSICYEKKRHLEAVN